MTRFDGKVIVLKGEEVLDIFETLTDAYWWAYDNELLGKVMIHKVGPGEENYTLTINSHLILV